MPRKLAVKTKHDWTKEKEAAKVLIYQGNSAADVSRILRVNEATVRSWIYEGQWKAQVQEVQALANQRQQTPSIAERVAFDMAVTKKETRAAWARSSHKVALWAEETAQTTPEVLFEMGSQYKAHVESSAKIAGDWEQESGARFAVSLSLNSIVQGGGVRTVPQGYTVVDVEGKEVG